MIKYKYFYLSFIFLIFISEILYANKALKLQTALEIPARPRPQKFRAHVGPHIPTNNPTDCQASLTGLDLPTLITFNRYQAKLFDNGGNYDIAEAILEGEVEIFKLVLNNRPDINFNAPVKGSLTNTNDYGYDYRDATALMIALHQDNPEMLELLLERIQGLDLNIRDVWMRTALHHAVEVNNIEVAKALIVAGADVNAQTTYENTPLHYATMNNNIEMVRALIAAEADVDVTNSYKNNDHKYAGVNTPLHIAILEGYTEVATELIKAEADLDIQNGEGKTPRQLMLEAEEQASE